MSFAAVSTLLRKLSHVQCRPIRPFSSSWLDKGTERPSWSEEWQRLGLGATLVDSDASTRMTNLFFVQLGFGVDQHGSDDATKASLRAVRNAIEFNSIPGVISHLPGGRQNMLIQVRLGVPPSPSAEHQAVPLPMHVDHLEVAKVFPYGRLLPIDVTVGGLSFPTGRVVEELGDTNDVGICVAASVTVGYNEPDKAATNKSAHTTYNTRDGH